MSKNPYNEAVAEEVRAMMARRQLSQLATAKRAGIPHSTFNRRVSGNSDFTITEIYRLADVFCIPVTKLIPAVAA